MPTEDVEMLAVRVFFDYCARPQSEAGADLHVLKLVLARGQCFVENVGLAVRRAVIQPHSRFDEAGGLLCGDGFTRHWKPLRRGYSLWKIIWCGATSIGATPAILSSCAKLSFAQRERQ